MTPVAKDGMIEPALVRRDQREVFLIGMFKAPLGASVSAGALIAALLAPAPALAQQAPDGAPAGPAAQQPPIITASAQPAAGQPATAQPADSPGEGDIVVTGFRASLRNALGQKQRSNQIIDAITAEDIADFPDANLAESIQRLPGVSIDRDNGEGRTITIRGLSGDFNRTRLNGLEALSTAGSNDSGTSPNRSRAFDYNTFASELFSSLKVQKTPSARTDEGSLGATIDLTTGRPFDYKKGAFALSVEDQYYDQSKKHNPRIAGLI